MLYSDTVNNTWSLNPCLPDLPNPLSHGYWNSSKWVSLVCKTHQWTPTEAGKCLQNKHLILLGDSTTKQWYMDLMELFEENSNLEGVEIDVKMKVIQIFNITVYWHFHPWAIGSNIKYIVDLKYEVDVIDEINETNCSKYVIVVSPWAHFTQWPRSSYVDRLKLLKLAIERLQARCPGATIIVKGPHPRLDIVRRPKNLFDGRDYILFEMNSIMRDIFSGIGAHYIDVWDLNLSHPAKNDIHMPFDVVRQELFMLLSNVCNE